MKLRMVSNSDSSHVQGLKVATLARYHSLNEYYFMVYV